MSPGKKNSRELTECRFSHPWRGGGQFLNPVRSRTQGIVPETHAQASLAAIPREGATAWQFPYRAVPAKERAFHIKTCPQNEGRMCIDTPRANQIPRRRQRLKAGPMEPDMLRRQRAVAPRREDRTPSNVLQFSYREHKRLSRPAPIRLWLRFARVVPRNGNDDFGISKSRRMLFAECLRLLLLFLCILGLHASGFRPSRRSSLAPGSVRAGARPIMISF